MVNRRKRFNHARVRSTTRAVPTQALAGVDPFTGNPAFDAALAQVGAAVTRIVGFIGVEFFGPSARATKAALDGRDGVQQGLEKRAVVVISGGEFDRQRDALTIDDHVALGACFASVGRVGAGERPAPFSRHAAAVQAGPAPVEYPQLAIAS